MNDTNEDGRRERRVCQHLARIGLPFTEVGGGLFNVRVYEGLVSGETVSLISVGLSQYVMPADVSVEVRSFELHMLLPKHDNAKDYAQVVFEAGDLIVERAFDSRQGLELGEVLPNRALKSLSTRFGYRLSSLLTGWAVWLPEELAWHDDQSLGPMAITDLIAITQQEEALYRADRAAFERLTESGEIDLLDLLRMGVPRPPPEVR